MRLTMCINRRLLACQLLVVSAIVFGTINSHAATPRWTNEPVSLQVQDESLRDFLQDLANLADVRILLSDAVQGQISGRFDDKPGAVFDKVAKAYGLLTYYDGSVIHISMAREIQSKSIKVKPVYVERVIETLVKRNLVDRTQTVEVDRKNGVIKLRGAPEFILDAEEVARAVLPTPTYTPRTVVRDQPDDPVMTRPDELVFRTFKLQYASAADVTFYQNGRDVTLPGVASMLRTMLGDGQRATDNSLSFNKPSDMTVPGLRGKGLRRYNTDVELAAVNKPGTSTSTKANRSVATGGGASVRILAEPNLNAVIVRDRASALPLYENLIAELDKEPMLVEIQVTIIDIDKNKLLDLGVDWRFESKNNDARFGGGVVENQNGGLILNTVLGDARRFFARVNALAETGSASITSRPQVLTLSNLEAVLANDESFFVRIAGNEEVDLFNVSVGTSLRVLPNVVGDKSDPQIRLLVTIEDGAIDPTESVDGIPLIERSSLNTQAVIFNGESLLLGGLVRDSASVVTTKVPLLGSVPGVGKLFQRQTKVESSTERLFLISPRLVSANRNSHSRPNETSGLYSAAGTPSPDATQAQYSQKTEDVENEYVDGF